MLERDQWEGYDAFLRSVWLIADALLVRHIRTEDIMTATRSPVHTLTSFAKVRGFLLTYPAEASQGTQRKPKHKRQSGPETPNQAMQPTAREFKRN